ncbi:MAG: hypothetical protein Q9168_004227 [Polycauliona sp. 1 TL-2023]
MDKTKAQELISQLERHHSEQIKCLQQLFGLVSKDEAEAAVGAAAVIGVKDGDAKFIAANALRDLANFTFERDAKFRGRPTDYQDQAAFYVIDYDQHRQKVLDTGEPAMPGSSQSGVLEDLFKQMAAFTIPYFSVTREAPATDCAPLTPNGIFSINLLSGKYICERKFSVSWTGLTYPNGPTLMVVLSPPVHYRDMEMEKQIGKEFSPPGNHWVINNLFGIVREWEEVLDALDAQTTLSSDVTFNSDARLGILFEDRNFSNSKRYFWALQSLRLFAEYIDGTMRNLSDILLCARYFDGSPRGSPLDWEFWENSKLEYSEKFGALRDRIERKRQEVQSLSDGLFSASSVAEGRLAAEQNSNIRLLTLVTIAYLPLNFASVRLPPKKRHNANPHPPVNLRHGCSP